MNWKRKGNGREGEEKGGRKEGRKLYWPNEQEGGEGEREGGMALSPSLARYPTPLDGGQRICQRERGLSVDGILWSAGHSPAEFYTLATLDSCAR